MEQAAGEAAEARAGTTQWRGFSTAWLRGFEKIYAIRLARAGAEHRDRLRTRPRALARWLGLAYGPVLVSLILPLGSEPAQRAALLLLLGTVNAGMLAAATLAWGYALWRAEAIDDLLHPSPERDAVPAIIYRALDWRWQAPLPVVFALLPWVVPLVAGSPPWSGWAAMALTVNLTWTMFLLGNVSYWLVVPPLLVIRIRSWTTLAMRWNDPARTPGVRTFSEGYAFSALFLALAAFAVTVPGLFGTPLFGAYVPYLYALLLALSIWVGVVTQAVIYAIVRRFRLRVLDELARSSELILTERRAAETAGKVGPELSNTLTVYGSIADAPGLPYGTALVVQYVAAWSDPSQACCYNNGHENGDDFVGCGYRPKSTAGLALLRSDRVAAGLSSSARGDETLRVV